MRRITACMERGFGIGCHRATRPPVSRHPKHEAVLSTACTSGRRDTSSKHRRVVIPSREGHRPALAERARRTGRHAAVSSLAALFARSDSGPATHAGPSLPYFSFLSSNMGWHANRDDGVCVRVRVRVSSISVLAVRTTSACNVSLAPDLERAVADRRVLDPRARACAPTHIHTAMPDRRAVASSRTCLGATRTPYDTLLVTAVARGNTRRLPPRWNAAEKGFRRCDLTSS
jgi:hypothetical protein